MGEIADMIIIGVLCQTCGCFIEEPPGGYPRNCTHCEDDTD
ncbi:hypothetical protein [Peribacillus frigoritolerans]|uniref:YhfH family protein n=1 Tax=Peribacillus castrilensis TaxID=2897690 RepID=A0AAW9NJ78_9BACI|nr:hypothetical protein [Peribacillus castrilensis]